MKKKYADMEPLEEIRAIRDEISREFKTIRDLGAYLRERRAAAAASSRSRKTSKKTAKQPKAARCLTHA